MPIIWGYAISVSYLILLFGLTWVLEKKFKVSVEHGRKILHTLLGLVWFILVRFFGSSFHLIVLPIIFVFINVVSYKTKLISIMERGQDNHPGTIYFAISTVILTSLCVFDSGLTSICGMAVLILSIGDGFAAIFGGIKRGNRTIYRKKTLFGFLACFLACFTICLAYMRFIQLPILWLIALPLTLAFIELFSDRGLDNLTLPLFTVFLIDSVQMRLVGNSCAIALISGCILILIILLARKGLTQNGAFAAFLLMFGSSLSVGIFGVLVYIIPFLGALVISLIVRRIAIHRNKEERIDRPITYNSHKRNAMQVFCNGAIAYIALIIYYCTNNNVYLITAAIVIISSFSDSVASDIGVFSKRLPLDIVTMKNTEVGRSGSVSLLGCASSLFACIVTSIVLNVVYYLINGAFSWLVLAVVGVIAYFGVFIDSIFGATIQAKFRCIECGKIVEKRIHCGQKAEHVKGAALLGNNAINFLTSLVVAIISVIILSIIFS
ncbi:MAG: DUF92 domain-containing protein [Clostridia bacterium]|nr:DUF92 domain-containing protein [Clostridia bacterium]